MKPLIKESFQTIGKSIYYIENEIAISLIRLGGKMATKNGISHILVFRHSFLPNLENKIVNGFEGNIFSYPIKIQPLTLHGLFMKKIKYKPSNLNYEYEKFIYSNKPRKRPVD